MWGRGLCRIVTDTWRGSLQHIMIDLGTGNNNKINWAMNDKQEFIDIVEVVYRGARKGRGLVVSPKGKITICKATILYGGRCRVLYRCLHKVGGPSGNGRSSGIVADVERNALKWMTRSFMNNKVDGSIGIAGKIAHRCWDNFLGALQYQGYCLCLLGLFGVGFYLSTLPFTSSAGSWNPRPCDAQRDDWY